MSQGSVYVRIEYHYNQAVKRNRRVTPAVAVNRKLYHLRKRDKEEGRRRALTSSWMMGKQNNQRVTKRCRMARLPVRGTCEVIISHDGGQTKEEFLHAVKKRLSGRREPKRRDRAPSRVGTFRIPTPTRVCRIPASELRRNERFATATTYTNLTPHSSVRCHSSQILYRTSSFLTHRYQTRQNRHNG